MSSLECVDSAVSKFPEINQTWQSQTFFEFVNIMQLLELDLTVHRITMTMFIQTHVLHLSLCQVADLLAHSANAPYRSSGQNRNSSGHSVNMCSAASPLLTHTGNIQTLRACISMPGMLVFLLGSSMESSAWR